MGVKQSQYSPQGQDTGRFPSMALWASCPFDTLSDGLSGGFGPSGLLVKDDFCPCPTPSSGAAIASFGQWASWGAAGTTIVDAAQEGGVMTINGTTANKSFILTSNAGGFRLVGASTGFPYFGKFWMECRLALGSVAASQQGVFFGLADQTGGQINASDTTIVASGGNTLTTTKNVLGMFNRTTTGPADFSAVFQPAAGTAVYPTNLTTLVNTITGANMAAWAAGTNGNGTGYVKLGMLFDPTVDNPATTISSASTGQTAGTIAKPLIQFFVNGVPLPAFLTSTNLAATTFPVNCVFSPVFQYMNIAGATAPVYLDWMMFAGLGTI